MYNLYFFQLKKIQFSNKERRMLSKLTGTEIALMYLPLFGIFDVRKRTYLSTKQIGINIRLIPILCIHVSVLYLLDNIMKIKENENIFIFNNLEIHLCKNVAAQLLAMMPF